MKRRKICIIIPKGLPVPAVGGGAIETLVESLINENEILSKLEITVACTYDQDALNKSLDYKHTRFIFIKLNYWLKVKSLFYLILSKITNVKYWSYNQAVLSKIKSREYDYIIVEGGASSYFESYLRYFSKSQMVYHLHYNGHTTREIENTFSKLISVSKFVKNDFAKESKLSSSDVLYNGINVDDFKRALPTDEKLQIRKSLGLDFSDLVLIYVGRLVPEKGVLELIKAVKSLADQRIKLLIVGGSEFRYSRKTKYVKEIETYVDQKRVLSTGFVSNSDVYKYYQISDILVVPSIWEEAFGLVLAEGMASGLPVIATKSGGMVEVLEGSGNLIVDLDNVVDKLAAAISLMLKLNYKKIGQDNVKIGSKYSIATFYDNFVNIIYSYDS